MRIKLTVEYDGTNFNGWQTQPGLRTVQSELESAIEKLTGTFSRVTASGRTDAGVHALGQVAHFDTQKDLGEKFAGGLNFYLPSDISVKRAEKVSEDFHARFSAKKKTYVYIMYEADFDSPLLKSRAAKVSKLDVEAMNEAAKLFVGKHDFAALRSTGSDTLTTERTVTKSTVERKDGLIVFTVTADGFLYNMVRKMAAALIKVGQGKFGMGDVKSLLEPGASFAPVAPPQGLYLYDVEYEEKGN